ncbi:DNA modification system-associated small protein [Spirosoma areae]
MKKGLDRTFVAYGIRSEDLNLIETLCTQHQLDFDWLQEEILKAYHDARIRDRDLDMKGVEKLIERALTRLP